MFSVHQSTCLTVRGCTNCFCLQCSSFASENGSVYCCLNWLYILLICHSEHRNCKPHPLQDGLHHEHRDCPGYAQHSTKTVIICVSSVWMLTQRCSLPLPPRSYYRPVRPQQQWYLLSRHQPVHHGRRCHLNGLTDGHPQQHHALRQLRRRTRWDFFVLPAPAWQEIPQAFLPQHTLTEPPTAAKTNIPKPVLCWHFSPCLSPSSSSVQSLTIWTVEHSYPSRLLSLTEETSVCLCWIHWDYKTC